MFIGSLDNFTVEHSTTNGLINISTSDCSIIRVILKNEPFHFLTHYTYGNYNASETLVNGKSYWKNTAYVTAIWYVSTSNHWTHPWPERSLRSKSIIWKTFIFQIC